MNHFHLLLGNLRHGSVAMDVEAMADASAVAHGVFVCLCVCQFQVNLSELSERGMKM